MRASEPPDDAAADGPSLRTLVDAVPAMLAYWDAGQRCRFANRAYERWFGVSPEALVGRHMSELLGPLYWLNLPFIEGALRGEAQEFEREIPDPGGGPPRQSLACYIPDVVAGSVRGFFVMVSDISSVKRAERALRESEERFRLTIDEAPIGMALVALDGRFSRVNRALCETVGYTQQELTGLTFQAITHPDDLDADLALAGQLARGEIPRYQLEKRYLRKDGSIVEVMLSGSAVRSPEGTLLYFIAQVEDISARKRLERERQLLADAAAALASSLDYEQTLAAVAERVVRDLADVCIVDVMEEPGHLRRLEVVCADPAKAEAAARLERLPLDRSRPYLLRPVVETKRPLLIERVTERHLEDAAQSPEHLAALRGLDPASLLALPLLMRGRLLGVLALVSSTPARAYGEDDLRVAGVLADRAAAALENAALYRAALEATKLRDQVLGIVVHDLRNPLGTVLLHAGALRERGGEDERRRAEAIEGAARRMKRLVDDLLDVSRMEEGRLSLRLARVAVGPLLEGVGASQAGLAAAASLDLRVEAPPDLPDVRADRDRLLQVLENLVGNAIKFTPPGGRITLGAAPGAGEVRLRVSDTGGGIAADDLPHVFDRFWQARRTDRGGAGLGLAIVRGIVEAHGGRVEVESAPGRGSTFSFTVPVEPGPGP
ncbi:MAG: PAS domain S-box protein [Planctomycetes bacterium]|nr:PAS domain S-box protein [Planctomycetota bacterium]